MQARLSIVLTGFFALGLGCAGGKDAVDDTQTNADDTVRTDDSSTTDDSSSTDDTSFGETFETEAESFVIVLNGAEWTASGGYYLRGDISYLKGELNTDPQETIDIEVAGNIRYAGTYDVTSIRYSVLPTSDAAIISSDLAPSLTVTVEGFADETNLFGTMQGTAALSGDGGDHSVTAGTFRHWPKF